MGFEPLEAAEEETGQGSRGRWSGAVGAGSWRREGPGHVRRGLAGDIGKGAGTGRAGVV